MSSTTSLTRRSNRFAYVFITPAALCFALFLAVPILYAIYISFRREQVVGLGLGAGGRAEIWAGLHNYLAVLSDPEFLASAVRVLLYGCVLVPVMLGLALLFALLWAFRNTAARYGAPKGHGHGSAGVRGGGQNQGVNH